jgi:hypothetical protein
VFLFIPPKSKKMSPQDKFNSCSTTTRTSFSPEPLGVELYKSQIRQLRGIWSIKLITEDRYTYGQG